MPPKARGVASTGIQLRSLSLIHFPFAKFSLEQNIFHCFVTSPFSRNETVERGVAAMLRDASSARAAFFALLQFLSKPRRNDFAFSETLARANKSMAANT